MPKFLSVATTVALCLFTAAAFAQEPARERGPAKAPEPAPPLSAWLSNQPQEASAPDITGSQRYLGSNNSAAAQIGWLYGTNAGGAMFWEGTELKLAINANSIFPLHTIGGVLTSGVTGGFVIRDRLTNPLSTNDWFLYATEEHFRVYRNGADRLTINSNGYLGLGVASAQYPLHVTGQILSAGPNAAIHLRDRSTGNQNDWLFYSNNDVLTLTKLNSGDVLYVNGARNVGIGVAAPAHKLHVGGNFHANGNVTASGDISASGAIYATYQDVAEWVPAASDLSDGTVVVLDPSANNHVMASKTAYDTAVAGVVSPQPGLILGEAGAAKEKIATTGRVRIKVDATRNPIRIGDLLVTSDKPGHAMRSEPIVVGSRRIHQPGTLIGKALEPLADGTGEILVLLSLQ